MRRYDYDREDEAGEGDGLAFAAVIAGACWLGILLMVVAAAAGYL